MKDVGKLQTVNFIFPFPQKIAGASEILVLFFENPNPGKKSRHPLIPIISVFELILKGHQYHRVHWLPSFLQEHPLPQPILYSIGAVVGKVALQHIVVVDRAGIADIVDIADIVTEDTFALDMMGSHTVEDYKHRYMLGWTP